MTFNKYNYSGWGYDDGRSFSYGSSTSNDAGDRWECTDACCGLSNGIGGQGNYSRSYKQNVYFNIPTLIFEYYIGQPVLSEDQCYIPIASSDLGFPDISNFSFYITDNVLQVFDNTMLIFKKSLSPEEITLIMAHKLSV